MISNQWTELVEKLQAENVQLLIELDDWKARFYGAVILGIVFVCCAAYFVWGRV
jgi:hypothetical protein